MEEKVLNELQKIQLLVMLGAKRVMTMSDCSLLTGLSKSHLYKLCSAKKIPHWKSSGGKITFFDKAEIENWCLSHRVKTSAEIESEAATYTAIGKRKGVKSV